MQEDLAPRCPPKDNKVSPASGAVPPAALVTNAAAARAVQSRLNLAGAAGPAGAAGLVGVGGLAGAGGFANQGAFVLHQPNCNCPNKEKDNNLILHGVNCTCPHRASPTVTSTPAHSQVCTYLTCPCPENVFGHTKKNFHQMQDAKPILPSNYPKNPTGYDLECKVDLKNCPIETFDPVPKSCLPRSDANTPVRYPTYNWARIDFRNFHAI